MIFFIVPAHNEEALVAGTIASLHRAGAAFGDYQIIVAADSCTDATAEVAAAAGGTVVPVSRRQISAARNAGAREALRRSTSPDDVLVFVDADTQVPELTLKAAIAALKGGAVGGGSAVRFDGPVPLFTQQVLKVFLVLFRLMNAAGGCFIFCTQRDFEATGGWDERLFAGEEVYMCGALKRQGQFVILREEVVTSGRKLREFGLGRILATLARLAVLGRRGVSSRKGLDLWYGPGVRNDRSCESTGSCSTGAGVCTTGGSPSQSSSR